jgi:hypothetical protein
MHFSRRRRVMANMSYCRFENTARDFRDCVDNINDPHISKSEAEWRLILIADTAELLTTLGYSVEEPDGGVVFSDENEEEDG